MPFKYLPMSQEKAGCSRKQATHKHVRAQCSFIGPDGVPGYVSGSGCPDSHGQYHGGRYEVRIPLCHFMEAPVLVQPQEHHSSGTTHSGSSVCDYRQTFLAQSGDPDGMVPSTGVQPPLPALGFSRGGPLCNQIQQQISQVRVPSSGTSSLGSGCSQPILGGSRSVCLSPRSPSGKCGEQGLVPRLQMGDPHCPRLAEHAVVLGSSRTILSDPSLTQQPHLLTQPFNESRHRDLVGLNLQGRRTIPAWNLSLILHQLTKPTPPLNR